MDYVSHVAVDKLGGPNTAITSPISIAVKFPVPASPGNVDGGLSTTVTGLEFSDGANTASLDTELKIGADVLASVDLNGTSMQLKRIVTGQMWKKRRGTCLAAEYATNAAIIGTETVTSKGGTATVTVSAGRVTFGAGTLWSLVLSNGSQYEYPVLIHPGIAMWYDVSGYGRHLTAVVASAANHCTTDWADGSEWLDSKGFTIGENLHVLRNVKTTTAVTTMRIDLDTYQYNRITANTDQHYIPIGNVAGNLASDGTTYGFKCKFKRISALTNAKIILRFSETLTGVSFTKSGPASVTHSTGWITINDLSADEWTDVTVVSTGFTNGASLGFIRLYAADSVAQTGGCIVKNLQIFKGATPPEYTRLRTDGVFSGKIPVRSSGVCTKYQTITCVGDSITAGVGGQEGTFVNALEDLFPGTFVINKGVASNTVQNVIDRFPDIIATNADAYNLLIGVNDLLNSVSLATIQSLYISLVNSLVSTGADIYLCEVTPCKGVTSWSAQEQAVIEAFNAWLPSLGLPVINTYSALNDLSNDGRLVGVYDLGDHIHMSNAGAKHLAATVAFGITDNVTRISKVSATGQPYTAPESLDSAVTTSDGTIQAWAIPDGVQLARFNKIVTAPTIARTLPL